MWLQSCRWGPATDSRRRVKRNSSPSPISPFSDVLIPLLLYRILSLLEGKVASPIFFIPLFSELAFRFLVFFWPLFLLLHSVVFPTFVICRQRATVM